MNSRRTRTVVALLAVSSILLLAAAGGAVPGLLSAGPLGGDATDDRPDDPTTEGTVGYVEGYWHDDELAVDDREGAVVEDDELEAVVYRSMARVEEIRGLTFDEEVSVDVVTRAEFEENNSEVFGTADGDERIRLNVEGEALFAVDNETDATDERDTLYGGAVGGYYEPGTDRVVVVSDDVDEPSVDEPVLGHELGHALQDQRFDIGSYNRSTVDQDNAKNGLVEGDATRIETEYETRCEAGWSCLDSAASGDGSANLNWVLYAMIFQPYSDGPDYVDHLLGTDDPAGDDWDAVDAAYDDPPASSSEVIRPGTEREPAGVDVEDRSNESWSQLEVDGEPATETYGEAGLVAMFAGDALDSLEPSVIDRESFLTEQTGEYDYDHPYTDGWADDELVTYVPDDASADDPTAAADRSGYVWETEWTSSEEAEQFLAGYREQLELEGADPVADRRDTYVIDEEFPGAYYLEHDGETVTIVHAPTVAELSAVDEGAAPPGEDEIDHEDVDPDDETTDDGGETIPGFGVLAALVAVAAAVAVAIRARD
ncbi:hypothetical protein GWG54_05160 [Natronococcus sp. JC468]|uniref:Hvo_1808 family surface protein n=1 Tax=Natronococcus sp. JC468 TaxID=1961921 RepID=UPI00143BA6B1|nr:Hvo_1808 family surface protein [Natronococcus sp. JC468]NKE35215.1 hypothetical protein [Natronococcus sp. JC468]